MARGNSRVVAGLALASVALLLGMGVALEAAHRSSKSALEDTFSQRAAITADLIASTLEQSVAQMQAAASLEFGDRRITEKALRGTDGLTPTIVTDAKGRVLGAYPPRLARRGSSIAGWGPGIKAVLAGRAP